MSVCDKNGGNCYWANCRRQPGMCSSCGWSPPDACHPAQMFCAICFEESADQAFAANPKWDYPACSAVNCRARSRNQAVERDLAMELRRPCYVMQACPPSLSPPCWGPPPGLPASATTASMYCAASPSSALTSTEGNLSLVDTVARLQDAVLSMSRKADEIMLLIEQIQVSIRVNPRFQPLFQ
jgi:hypothetical protein